MVKEALRIRGLRQRWIVNTIMPVFVVLLMVVILFSAGISSYYFSSMQTGLENKAQAAAEFFNSYAMNNYSEYYQMAANYTDTFEDKDRMELQFINSSGRIQVSTYGLTAGTSPGTEDISQSIDKNEMSVFQGEDPQTGENILSVSYPLSFNGKVVGVMRFVTSLRAVNRQILLSVLVVFLFAAICMALVVISNLLFINNVVEPVAVVSDAAKRISKGSYGIQIENRYTDELGELVENVNDMQLYNSVSHQKEDFVPNHPGQVKMYTCGPTVYHFAHIGNLRSYIMEDVLEKYLRYVGYDVKRVMNITDVGHLTSDADSGEDKMLKGARREHKTVMEIAQFYTDAFFEDCRKLNIKTPDVVEPATHCIDEYIAIITRLLEKGYAYQTGGNVYFDTSKLEKYYVFNDQNEEDLAVGVREGVEEDRNKRNKNDFVLWFTKSKFEDQALKWDSPWGVGYPGWHIECSGISIKHLGEDLDIHCGGIDNAFPHHTNEIAQSEAYLGHHWCNYWFHVLHLNTQDGKMSKSSGEFLTVSLLEKKGYDPLVYRLFCLQSYYRKTLLFSYENLDNTAAAYQKLIARIAALRPDGEGPEDEAAAAVLRKEFTDALDNDLATAQALTVLYDVLKYSTDDSTKRALLAEFDTVLGLDLLKKAAELGAVPEASEDEPEIDAAVAARTAAKKAKDWAEADRIRDELKTKGIELTDTPQGTLWKKI